MAEVYTDTEAADGLFSDTLEDVQEPESEVPEAPVQSEEPTVPVSSEPDSLDQQADSSGNFSVSTDAETSEGMEEISTVDSVEQIDYTDLLKQQNQYLESLVMETRETNEHLGLRNWCIVHLMLDAGLRSSEVINLRFCDLLSDKNIIQIWKSKGSKTRLVILCPRLKVNLMKYCVLYRNYTQLPGHSNVFMQMKNHKPINSNVIKQFFSRLKKKTGIDRIHPHLCRHTFATAYIIGGGSLEMLRLLLGHSDYEVTRSYLHLAHQCQLLHSDVYRLDPIYFKKLS